MFFIKNIIYEIMTKKKYFKKYIYIKNKYYMK